jgi:hypothetical protein
LGVTVVADSLGGLDLIGRHSCGSDGEEELGLSVSASGIRTPVGVIPSVGAIPDQRHEKSFKIGCSYVTFCEKQPQRGF